MTASALITLVAVLPQQAEPLRINLPPGTRLAYEMTETTTMRSPDGEQAVQAAEKFSFEVSGVQDGWLSVRYLTTELSHAIQSDDGSLPPLEKENPNITVSLLLSRQGKTKQWTVADPGKRKPDEAAQFMKAREAENTGAGLLGLHFPEHGVKVGDTWEIEEAPRNNFNLEDYEVTIKGKLKTVYKLEELGEDDGVRIAKIVATKNGEYDMSFDVLGTPYGAHVKHTEKREYRVREADGVVLACLGSKSDEFVSGEIAGISMRHVWLTRLSTNPGSM